MGVVSDTPEQLEAALVHRSRREWACPLPPSLVVSESVPRAAPGQPARGTGRQARGAYHPARGWRHHHAPARSSAIARSCHHGIGWPEVCAETNRLPADLPLGYHDITLRIGTLEAQTRYIVTPDRAWTHPNLGRTGRAAGVSLSLYGVRSARNWGCGDFRDLQALVDWVAEELQASFVGLNPLHAIHNRKPFNTSPYLPNCIYYQNFIYLDVEGIPDYTRSRRAQRLRWRKDTCAELESLRASPLVEYERVAALKLRFLKLLFVQFLREWRGRLAARASVPDVRCARGRVTGKVRHLLRARRVSPPAGPGGVDLDPMAGGVPRSGVARRPFVPGQTLALGNVLSVPAVADRSAIDARAAVGAVAPAGHRSLPRSRAGHRSLRRGSLGAPALLHSQLPGRFAPR